MHQDATCYGGRPQPRSFRKASAQGTVFDGDPTLPPQKGGRAPFPNFRPMSIVAKRLDGPRRHLARRWALSRPHCARWGPSSRPQKVAELPIFGPSLLWPNGWMHQDATEYGGRPQPSHFVLDWDPTYCWQTAVCIRIQLGTEVD